MLNSTHMRGEPQVPSNNSQSDELIRPVFDIICQMKEIVRREIEQDRKNGVNESATTKMSYNGQTYELIFGHWFNRFVVSLVSMHIIVLLHARVGNLYKRTRCSVWYSLKPWS